MKTVAVAHPDLRQRGGAEGVSMNILEALQDEFELTLLTLAAPDFSALNEYYGTDVISENIDLQLVGGLGPRLHDILEPRIHTLRMSLFFRQVQRRADRYDLLVSTYNELPVPADVDSVQYIHMPQFERFISPWEGGFVKAVHDFACSQLIDFSVSQITANQLVTNSSWTASVVERAYGVSPRVVYPPIDTDGMVDVPWNEREAGFVAIGRISPEKNILELIDIVEGVRERGHDVHLHIVGPIPDTSYAAAVERSVAQTGFVSLEGILSRDDLLTLICHHRFGLHGMTEEHYGMAVAELVAGGTVPFLPNDGGQCEIVADNPSLLYGTPTEAVDVIDRLLSHPALCERVRAELAASANYSEPSRFQSEFHDIVTQAIETTR